MQKPSLFDSGTQNRGKEEINEKHVEHFCFSLRSDIDVVIFVISFLLISCEIVHKRLRERRRQQFDNFCAKRDRQRKFQRRQNEKKNILKFRKRF